MINKYSSNSTLTGISKLFIVPFSTLSSRWKLFSVESIIFIKHGIERYQLKGVHSFCELDFGSLFMEKYE